MRALTVKRTDWHFRFMKTMCCNPSERGDICAYIRGLIDALFKVFLLLTIGAGACFIVGDFLAWLAACIVNLSIFYPNVGAAFVAIMLSISVICGLIYLIQDRARKIEFISAVADSVVNKICFPVRLED